MSLIWTHPRDVVTSTFPLITPMCARCEAPVTGPFTRELVPEPLGMTMEVTCEGQLDSKGRRVHDTMSTFVRLTLEEIQRYSSGLERLVVFRPKGRKTLFRY